MKRAYPLDAFSLLELIVVLIIIALLASLAGLTLKTHLQHAALTRAQLVASQSDTFCRQLSQQQPAGTVQLVIDARRRRLIVQPVGRVFVLPAKVGLTASLRRIAGQVAPTSQIQFNAPGVSPDYALQFQQADTARWVAFFGLSGQQLGLTGDDELMELFQ
jgi:prepilin-type N-terminal cleavage/methylation domain-containing protein